jgi:hypothetical protein
MSVDYVLNGIAILLEATSCDVADDVAQITVDELKKLVDPSADDRSYQTLYLTYKVWSLLADKSVLAANELASWGTAIDQNITTETLKNVHAVESSTCRRDVADFNAMEKLLDFVETGDNIPSMGALCCAIDLVVLQVLKKPTSIHQSTSLDNLRLRVQSLLGSLRDEAVKSDSRDKSAKVIKFFCEYRMSLLGLRIIPDKLKKEKGNIAVSSKLVNTSGMKLNEHIIAELLEFGSVDPKLIELQNSKGAEARE